MPWRAEGCFARLRPPARVQVEMRTQLRFLFQTDELLLGGMPNRLFCRTTLRNSSTLVELYTWWFLRSRTRPHLFSRITVAFCGNFCHTFPLQALGLPCLRGVPNGGRGARGRRFISPASCPSRFTFWFNITILVHWHHFIRLAGRCGGQYVQYVFVHFWVCLSLCFLSTSRLHRMEKCYSTSMSDSDEKKHGTVFSLGNQATGRYENVIIRSFEHNNRICRKQKIVWEANFK